MLTTSLRTCAAGSSMLVIATLAAGCGGSSHRTAQSVSGITEQRLPIRLTTAGTRRMSLDVTWVARCISGVQRTTRRQVVRVSDGGHVRWTGGHVDYGGDDDEERQRLRLTGRVQGDGSLKGTWSVQMTQVNGEAAAHGGPGDGVRRCATVEVPFTARPGGSVQPPLPRIDKAGHRVIALARRPQRLAAAGGLVWTRDGDDAGVTALDAQTGRVVGQVPKVTGYKMAAGAGAVWIADDSVGTSGEVAGRLALTRVDARTRRAETVLGERGTRGSPFLLGVANVIAVGHGAVWLIEGDRLLRADPRSGRVVARIRLPRDRRDRGRSKFAAVNLAQVVATAGDDVWVTMTILPAGRSPALYSLVRVDARTDRVTRTVPLRRAYDHLIADGDGVWATTYARPQLHRIDLGDGTPADVTPLASPTADSVRGLGVTPDAVWVAQATGDGTHGVLLRIDRRTGRRTAELQLEGEPTNVAVENGNVWVADTYERTLIEVPR